MSNFGFLLREKALELKLLSQDPLYQQYLTYFKTPDFQAIEGCTDEEIERLKTAQNVKNIPQVYLDYLRHFGRKSGDFFIGYDVNLEQALHLKEGAIRMINRFLPNHEIPSDSFFFLGDQAVNYWYFRTDNKEYDPPVYVVSEIFEDDPEYFSRMPYRDNHGVGWPHFSHFISGFILQRAGQAAYDEFLQQVAKLR